MLWIIEQTVYTFWKKLKKVLNSRKVCWNNFLAPQRLILLYCFHQKILKEKTAILENITLIIFFTSFDITIYLYIKKRVCIIYAWIVHRWIVNRWIVYRELAQPENFLVIVYWVRYGFEGRALLGISKKQKYFSLPDHQFG